MFLMLPGLGWGDIGTTTIDDSAHAAPAAADTPVVPVVPVVLVVPVVPRVTTRWATCVTR